MSKTCRDLRAFYWGKFSWKEMICVKKLTCCNSGLVARATRVNSCIVHNWILSFRCLVAEVVKKDTKQISHRGQHILLYICMLEPVDVLVCTEPYHRLYSALCNAIMLLVNMPLYIRGIVAVVMHWYTALALAHVVIWTGHTIGTPGSQNSSYDARHWQW